MISDLPPVAVRARLRFDLFTAAILIATPVLGAAYNGPDDPAAYMVPSILNCSGVERYPNGIKIKIPERSTVGNLYDGLQYLYPEGMFTIIAFYFTGQGGADELDYVAIRGSVFGSEWLKSKGVCRIDEWHPE